MNNAVPTITAVAVFLIASLLIVVSSDLADLPFTSHHTPMDKATVVPEP
jgi:hypothetical protein